MNKTYNFDRENSKRESIVNVLKADNVPVVIYGTGKFGKTVAEFLADNSIPILCFLDNEEYWFPGKTITIAGNIIQCVTKVQLQRTKELYNILAGMIDFSLLDNLREEFTNCHYIEYLDVIPSHVMSNSFLAQNSETIREIYSILEDEESRQVLEAYLYARYTGDVDPLSRLMHDSRYLYDWELLALSKNDIVIDGGAYTGDSILEMKEYLGEFPKKIYAFEPDINNVGQIASHFSFEEREHISVINAGLYSRDGIVHFSASGTLGSEISEDAEETIVTHSLDMHSEYGDATIIKMDIEGSEVDALQGGKLFIERNQPNLAICIYHRNQDLVTIYKFLKKFNYRFYLRQHSASVEETVLYAVH